MSNTTSIIICLALSAVFVVWCAWHGNKQTKTAGDFIVAGRGMPWWFVGGSLLATSTSGALFLGVVSGITREGFHTLWLNLGIAASFLVICFLIGPRLRRFGGYTVPEYLSRRFNAPGLRPIFSIVTILWMIVLMSTVVVQGGVLLDTVWNFPYEVSVTLMVLAVLAYTVTGGQKSIMYTDFVQLIIFLGAAAVLIPFTVNFAGGITHVATTANEIQPGFLSSTGGVATGVAGAALFFSWFMGYLGHPGLLSRFYTARSEKDIYKSGIAVTLVYLPMVVGIALVGASLRVIDPNTEGGEEVWLNFVLNHAPALLAGLLFAGIAMAALSTADTWLLTAASTATNDVVNHFRKIRLTDQQLKRWTKWAVLLGALLALPLAIARPAFIVDMMTIAYSVAGASGGVVITASLYWRRMTKRGAWAGMIIGATTAIAAQLCDTFLEMPDWFDPVLPTLATSIVAVVLFSLIDQKDIESRNIYDQFLSSKSSINK